MAARRAAYSRPTLRRWVPPMPAESWRASPAHTAPWGEASSAKSLTMAAVKVPTLSEPCTRGSHRSQRYTPSASASPTSVASAE